MFPTQTQQNRFQAAKDIAILEVRVNFKDQTYPTQARDHKELEQKKDVFRKST